jgi:hypothetical protein
LNKANNELLKWRIIPAASYPFFLLTLDSSFQLWGAFLAVIVGFALTSISSLKINQKIIEPPSVIKPPPVKTDLTTNKKNEQLAGTERIRTELFVPILILFGSILLYQALSVFTGLGVDLECNTENVEYFHCFAKILDFGELLQSNGAILLMSFFAIGVLYYHGCMIVLRGTPIEAIGGKNRYPIAEYAVILVEAIILFFAATSIGSLVQFTTWIILLIVIDLIWIFCNLKETLDLAFHWIYFDFTVLFFLIVLASTSQQDISAHLSILTIFVARTILDYKIGWKKFWSKYTGGLL